MIATTDEDARAQDASLPAESRGVNGTASETIVRGHFDTFETDFFQAGEDSEKLAGTFDQLDELDDGSRRRWLLSRPTLLGLAIASTCVALLACTALWRSNAPIPALPSPDRPATKPGATAARVDPPAAPAPAPAVAPAEIPPTPSLPVAASATVAAAESPPPPAPTPAAAPAAVAATEDPPAPTPTRCRGPRARITRRRSPRPGT